MIKRRLVGGRLCGAHPGGRTQQGAIDVGGPRLAVISGRRVLLVAVVVLAVIALATVLSRGGASGERLRPTRIVVYQPTGFKALQTVEGRCWTGSLAAPRAGAFRCMVGNQIHDPCFVLDQGVACPQGDPARNEGIVLRLTEPLPQPPEAWTNPPDPAHPSPWHLRLAGGGQCGVLTGTRLPDYPIGCQLPEVSQGAVCSPPLPLARSRGVYTLVCGSWDAQSSRVVNLTVYPVEVMWL